jgi:hypothetical protein
MRCAVGIRDPLAFLVDGIAEPLWLLGDARARAELVDEADRPGMEAMTTPPQLVALEVIAGRRRDRRGRRATAAV